jgi:hypothetical protein
VNKYVDFRWCSIITFEKLGLCYNHERPYYATKSTMTFTHADSCFPATKGGMYFTKLLRSNAKGEIQTDGRYL